jgi:tetratricopeptide (TPR) repeat protein
MQVNYRQAETFFKGGLGLWRELKDSKRESSLLLEVGNFYASWSGYCSVAIDYYERSLPIFRELKNRGGEGAALGGIGNCYEKQGKPDKAIEYLTQSLAIAREVKNRRNEAISLTGLGKPYFKTLYGKFFQSPELDFSQLGCIAEKVTPQM